MKKPKSNWIQSADGTETVRETDAARERALDKEAFRLAAEYLANRISEGQSTMTLFWHMTGPKITYRDGLLEVSNLNPEVQTQWTMSRGEMLSLGWHCIIAALRQND